MTPSSKSRQRLLDLGSSILGVVLLGGFGWFAYQNVAARLVTQKLPPSLLDKGLFFVDGLKIYHWGFLVAGLFLLAWPVIRKKSAGPKAGDGPSAGPGKSASKKASRHFGSCNVLQAEKEVRQLWQFSVFGDKVALQREESRLPNEQLPANIVGKDWQSLFQPKLNVAWLPSDQVFLRALQLPKADDLTELQSMVELQLEKLSPIPVTQAVWTFETVRTAFGDLQTVIVIIVARSLVEEFLGKLEGQGYLADRLELPLLDQVRATQIDGDGLWIYPSPGPDPGSCLVAWWYGDTLRNLGLVRLPSTEHRGPVFQEQLNQMAWAGELEGWLTAPPRIHLVAEAETASVWTPMFSSEQAVEIVPPLPSSELATMTAKRATAAGEGGAGLMLPEFAARYRQQFIDRLWMRGVGAIVLLYVFVVVVYFGLSEWANWRLDDINSQIATSAQSYTNALQLKEQVRVLQDQIDLQYAALDCYKAVAEFLPEGLTLDQITFDKGGKFSIIGNGPSEESPKVTDFNEKMRNATVKDQPLFTKVQAPSINPRPNNQISWNFVCELRRTDSHP